MEAGGAVTGLPEGGDLRERLVARYGDWLADCATTLARSVAAGGRVFCFTDTGSVAAAQVARLFAGLPTNPLVNGADDLALARQLETAAGPGEIAVGLSVDGRGEGLLRAFDAARDRGMVTVGVVGCDRCPMTVVDTIDYLFVVASTAPSVRDAQTAVCRLLAEFTRDAVRPSPASPVHPPAARTVSGNRFPRDRRAWR